MDQLKELVKAGNAAGTVERVRALLDDGKGADEIMKVALIPAMDEVGDLFSQKKIFVPEMLIAARAMQKGLEVLKPRLLESGIKAEGKVLIGTVKGDLHDIGKNLVIISLEGAGLEVVDLGTDVSPEKFVEAIKEHSPHVVALSALLTTTMAAMRDTIEEIKKAGLREKVKVIIGGAPVQQQFCDEIGADFYGEDPTLGRNYIRQVIAAGD